MDWITKELTTASYSEEAEEIEVAGDWKRQPDGSWKLTRDCWNHDKPFPSASK